MYTLPEGKIMLPQKISDLSEVEEKYQSFYTQTEDGYSIDANLQGPDVTGLKATNVDLKNEKSTIKNELETVKEELRELQAQETEQKLLEKENYSELLVEKETAFKNDLEHATSELQELRRVVVTEKLTSIAKEIAGENAALLMPHLTGLEYDEGIQFPGGVTQEDYITSIKDNPLFQPLMSHKASGGGASTSSSAQAADTQAEKYFNPNSNEYSPTKQGDIQQENPELYQSMSKKFGLDDPFAPVGQRAYSPQNNQGAGVTFKGQ